MGAIMQLFSGIRQLVGAANGGGAGGEDGDVLGAISKIMEAVKSCCCGKNGCNCGGDCACPCCGVTE